MEPEAGCGWWCGGRCRPRALERAERLVDVGADVLVVGLRTATAEPCSTW